MPSEEVVSCVADDIATILFNRAEKRNAVTPHMRAAFFDLIDDAVLSPDVRAIVVGGSGTDFCVGADMEWLKVRTETGAPSVFPFERLADIPKPLICAVQGVCTGMGLLVASMSDVRVVATDVRFVNVFARRGLALEYGLAWHLPRLIGHSRALDMLMSGREIGAAEALDWGLANQVVRGDPVAAAQEYASALASQASPSSLAAIKWQLARAAASDYPAAVREARQLGALATKSPDFHEGVASFTERRAPRFAAYESGWFSPQEPPWQRTRDLLQPEPPEGSPAP